MKFSFNSFAKYNQKFQKIKKHQNGFTKIFKKPKCARKINKHNKIWVSNFNVLTVSSERCVDLFIDLNKFADKSTAAINITE